MRKDDDGYNIVSKRKYVSFSWYTLGGALSKSDITSKTYSPFGEQLSGKFSGFGYNGEMYDAATDSIYLRARNYEPAPAITGPDERVEKRE